MHSELFTQIIEQQMNACKDVLISKAGEYATDDDRLHNFRVAGSLEGLSARQALVGMMAKHTVSIYDMCRDDEYFDISVWDEKIGDHLNYLLLLKAIVYEEHMQRVRPTISE